MASMNGIKLVRRLFARPWLQSVLFGAVASFLYGGWAYFANIAYPQLAVTAAVTQGALSFMTTFAVTWLMNFLFGLSNSAAGKIVTTVSGTTLLVGIVSYLVHFLAGTPNALLTIAPSVGLGAFLGALVWSLAAVKALQPQDQY